VHLVEEYDVRVGKFTNQFLLPAPATWTSGEEISSSLHSVATYPRPAETGGALASLDEDFSHRSTCGRACARGAGSLRLLIARKRHTRHFGTPDSPGEDFPHPARNKRDTHPLGLEFPNRIFLNSQESKKVETTTASC